MSACDEILELMSASLDGELTVAERDALDVHLASCETCREELVRMQRTWDALGVLGQVEVPPRLAERVIARARSKGAVWRRVVTSRWTVLVAAAAVLLVALVAGYMLQQRTTGTEVKSVPVVVKNTAVDESSETMEIVKNIDLLENLDVLESLDTLVDMGDKVLLLPGENGSENGNGGES